MKRLAILIWARLRTRQRRLRLLLRHPFMYARAQHIHRDRAAGKNLIVETTNVEFVAQLVLRVLTELQDFQLPYFVPECLRRPRHVAVGFALHRDFVDS